MNQNKYHQISKLNLVRRLFKSVTLTINAQKNYIVNNL